MGTVLLGIAAVVLGFLLITRPLSSLATLGLYVGLSFIVSGVTDLVQANHTRAPLRATVLAAAWIAVGAIVLIWQGLTVGSLQWVIAVALVVSGVVKCIAALRGTTDERFAALVFGLTEIVLGMLALQWPDVTLLVVAILFGIRTVLFGLSSIWMAIGRVRGRDGARTVGRSGENTRRRSAIGRWSRSIAAVVVLALAIGVGIVGGQLRADSPVIDAFYTSLTDIPDRPGVLLRTQPLTRGIPDGANTWRILYTTTTDDGMPALASGLVMVAADAPAGPRPVIAWAHGTTGYASNCAPTSLKDPLGSGALPAVDQIIEQHWVLVATDYTGLGTEGPQPYLIGQGEARSILDAVRAARQLDQISMSDETVVWGHSQGGHAALWTGQVAPQYAPDVHLIGVAALAPASDTVALTKSLPTVTGGSVFGSYVIEAYTQTYADVDFNHYIIPAARTLVREMASRCLSEPGVLVSVLSALSIDRDRPIFSVDPTDGPFGQRLKENVPTGPIPASLLIGQGLADPLINPAMQKGYVDRLCASGQQVDYRTYAGRDHLSVVAPDSPLIGDLITWTLARIADEPAISTCAK